MSRPIDLGRSIRPSSEEFEALVEAGICQELATAAAREVRRTVEERIASRGRAALSSHRGSPDSEQAGQDPDSMLGRIEALVAGEAKG